MILAVLFYILYLWHHIRDGSLSRYCRRKIDTRLHKIVMKKVNKALAKDSKTRANERAKDPKAGNFRADVKPTLPVLDSTPSANTTLTDVGGPEPTVPKVFSDTLRPQLPYRSVTQSSFRSDGSYESNAPLLNSAGEMGYGGNGHPGSRGAPSRMDSEVRTLHSARPPNRSFTGNSQSTERSFNSSSSRSGPPNRQNSDISERMTPVSIPYQLQSLKPMLRDNSVGAMGRRPSGPGGFNSQEFEMHSTLNRANKPASNGGYLAYNPHTQSTSSGAPVSAYSMPSSAAPSRNLTLPSRAPNDYFGSIDRPAQRSGTAPLPPANTLNASPDDPYAGNWQQSFTRPVGPSRPATAIPSPGYGQRRPMPPRY